MMRRLSMVLCCVFLVVLGPTLSHAQETLPTLAEQIAANDDLTTFQQLLDAADPQMLAWLENPANQFTVFAPTNAAWELLFADMGVTVEEYIERTNWLEDKLRLLMVPMALTPMIAPDSQVFVQCDSVGSMLPDSRLFLESWSGETSGFRVSFEDITDEPLTASNGLLYITDHVLPEVSVLGMAGDHTPDDVATRTPVPVPPTVPLSADADLLNTLADDGRFSILLDLLSQNSGYQDILSSDGLYMLFAPTDAAFERYFSENSSLSSETFEQESGATFLSYNILPGYFTPDVFFEDYRSTDADFCSYYEGDVVQIRHDGDTVLIGDVPLTGESLVASNGVIFVTDGIHLDPPSRG